SGRTRAQNPGLVAGAHAAPRPGLRSSSRTATIWTAGNAGVAFTCTARSARLASRIDAMVVVVPEPFDTGTSADPSQMIIVLRPSLVASAREACTVAAPAAAREIRSATLDANRTGPTMQISCDTGLDGIRCFSRGRPAMT